MNRRRYRPLAALAMVALLAGGCGGGEDAPTPEEERRDRLSERLLETFDGPQAECILDRIDDDLVMELDQRNNLAPDSRDLNTWSEALRSCVVGSTGAAGESSD